MNWYSIIFAGKNCLNLLSFLIVWSQENILHRNVWVIFWWIIIIFKFNRCACNLILSSFLNINLYYVVTYKRVKELSHTHIIIVLSRVITCDQILKCVPGRGKRIKSVYRVAERAHILCTASWSQVAKCVPIHSLNITTIDQSEASIQFTACDQKKVIVGSGHLCL